MSDPVISVVVVTWNCQQFVEECLASLRSHVHCPAEIIVVDNASTDGTVAMIGRRFPEVEVIALEQNIGFARANNLGIKKTSSRYIALVNPDVKVLPGCFDRALATIDEDPSIGVLGPAMIGRDGAVHRSGMRFPSLWNTLCDALALHQIFGASPLFGGQMMADFGWDSRRDVDVLNGWFWLIRRAALEQVGLLDEQFFMYGEDLDWCRRFRNAGWRLVFEPQAAAIHYGGGSSDQAPLRFYVEMQRATLQYWQKHHGSARRVAYSGILWLNHLVRMAAYGLLCIVRPKDTRSRLKWRLHAACLWPAVFSINAALISTSER